MNLDELNALPAGAGEAAFLRCCGATRWARQMTIRRPFAAPTALFAAADEIWAALSPDDWREAFSRHPRIGDVEGLRGQTVGTRSWETAEQAGAAAAPRAVLRALSEGNRRYEERFGHLFLICATGKSAEEMLERLLARLENTPAAELPIAAEEQRKITRLRLEKVLRETTREPNSP